MLLLRAIVAPVYLVRSGGDLVLQGARYRHSHLPIWAESATALTVPPLAFILVAVGADYNLLFASRLRDESPSGSRHGIIRTLARLAASSRRSHD